MPPRSAQYHLLGTPLPVCMRHLYTRDGGSVCRSFGRPSKTHPTVFGTRARVVVQARRWVSIVILVLAAHPCAAQQGAAQQGAQTPAANAHATSASAVTAPPADAANAVGIWIAGSFATGGPIGNISQGRLGLLALRYERRLVPSTAPAQHSGPVLTYTVDLFPALWLSVPGSALPTLVPRRPASASGLTTYGVGVSPAGLRLAFRRSAQVRPFLSGSTGLAYFTAPVPTAWGRRLNFTFDLGIGVEVLLPSRLRLTAGYRYHHLSNGFRGRINPGIDGHLLCVGLVVSP